MTRRSHQCRRDGCDSSAVWKMFVRFESVTPAGQKIPCTAETSIIVCDRHRRDAAEGFVSAHNMDKFAAQLERENMAVPHPDSIGIEFGRLARDTCILDIQIATAIIPCDRADCVLPAKVQIALKLWSIGQPKRAKPLQVLTGLCVCNRHRNESTVKNVLTPEAKSGLLGQLTERGVPMPDFRTVELAFVAIKEGRKADPARFACVGV